MAESPQTKTDGAIKAGRGLFVFDVGSLNKIAAGPDYSTAHGPVIEGDRTMVGLMRFPKGTGGKLHSHPNEQWIYVMEGTIEGSIDKLKVRAPTGSIIFIPANALHEFYATADRDVVFFTAKDNAHSIHGIKA